LARNFRRSVHSLLALSGQNIMAAEACAGSSPHGRQEARGKDCRNDITFEGMPPTDLLSPVGSYLLTLPSLPKIVLPSGDQAFNT
jgi:hypothetical protein